jgi:hypothetical protein
LSSLYASDLWARLDSVDEVEVASDALDFARALRESITDCGYGGTKGASGGAESSVAGGAESDPSDLARALRESISDCEYGGTGASSAGIEMSSIWTGASSGGTEASSERAGSSAVGRAESDTLGFARILGESNSNCGHGGIEPSSGGEESGVAGLGVFTTMGSRASVGATAGRDSCRYRSGNNSVLPSRLEVSC